MFTIVGECKTVEHVAPKFHNIVSQLPFKFQISSLSLEFCLGWFLLQRLGFQTDMKMTCLPGQKNLPFICTRSMPEFCATEIRLHLQHNYKAFLQVCYPKALSSNCKFLILLEIDEQPYLVGCDSFDVLLGLGSFMFWKFGNLEGIHSCFVEEEEQNLYYKFQHSENRFKTLLSDLLKHSNITNIILDFFPTCLEPRCETKVFLEDFCEVCSGKISKMFLTSICLEPC